MPDTPRENAFVRVLVRHSLTYGGSREGRTNVQCLKNDEVPRTQGTRHPLGGAGFNLLARCRHNAKTSRRPFRGVKQ